MGERKKEMIEKDFISYLDDDDLKKDKHVIIINKTSFGVEFKFDSWEQRTITIPWNRILKIKEIGGESHG